MIIESTMVVLYNVIANHYGMIILLTESVLDAWLNVTHAPMLLLVPHVHQLEIGH